MWVKSETFESLLKFWRMHMQLYLSNRRLSKRNRDTEIEIFIIISSLWDVHIKKTTKKKRKCSLCRNRLFRITTEKVYWVLNQRACLNRHQLCSSSPLWGILSSYLKVYSFVFSDLLSRNISQKKKKKMTKGVFCGSETISLFTLSTVDAVLCFELNSIFSGYSFQTAWRTSKLSSVCAENSWIPHITVNF